MKLLFSWLIRLPGILFLSENSLKSRFGAVLKIILYCAFVAFSPQIARFWIILHPIFDVALWIFSFALFAALLSIYSSQAYARMSISERWKRACIECGFLLIDPNTNKKTVIPGIAKKEPNLLIVNSRATTPRQIEEFSDSLAGAMGVHIWHISTYTAGGEVRPGFTEIHYTTYDMPHMIPFRKMPKPEAGELYWGYSVDGWLKRKIRDDIHIAIIGQSGQGKSVLMRSLFLQLYFCNPGATFLLIDFKAKQEFGVYEQFPNVAVFDSHKPLIAALKAVHGEYLRRSSALVKYRAEHAADLNIPPVFIFIDELANALSGHKNMVQWNGKKIPSYPMQLAQRLISASQLYRSANIYIIAGAQRMDAESIPPQFRENLGTRCAFRVGSQQSSIMLLNYADAFKLERIPGRFILATETGLHKKLQAPYVSKQDAVKLLQKCNYSPTPLFQAIKNAVASSQQRKK